MSDNVIKELVTGIELEEKSNSNICIWGIEHLGDEIEDRGEETNRTDLRRQRDRILYTGGFRRLQDKTQVISSIKNGDHRTRLTHTLEVVQIAISMADALGLNRDLVSAIALGHDIGHTPFGHAVERFLDKRLRGKGGFSHAVQSIRYLHNRNVKLSNDILEGILKHDSDVYAGSYNEEQFDCSKYNPTKPGNLETQVVYWADKLAYITHDFEDFFSTTDIYKNAKEHEGNLEDRLKEALINLIPEKEDIIRRDINKFETRDLIRNLLRKLLNQSLINIRTLYENNSGKWNSNIIIEGTECRIKKAKEELILKEFKRKEDKKSIRKILKKAFEKGLIINFDTDYYEHYRELRTILDDYYIQSPDVQRSDAKAVRIVGVLYDEFLCNYKILPFNVQDKIENGENKERIIADYIASMTDRYVEEVFLNLNSIGNIYKY